MAALSGVFGEDYAFWVVEISGHPPPPGACTASQQHVNTEVLIHFETDGQPMCATSCCHEIPKLHRPESILWTCMPQPVPASGTDLAYPPFRAKRVRINSKFLSVEHLLTWEAKNQGTPQCRPISFLQGPSQNKPKIGLPMRKGLLRCVYGAHRPCCLASLRRPLTLKSSSC